MQDDKSQTAEEVEKSTPSAISVLNSSLPKLTITNIKCSVKIPCTLSLDEVRKRCEHDFSLHCVPYSNFIVIKEPRSSLRIVFFKQKADKKVNCHANITGISSFADLDSSLNFLSSIIQCKREDVKHQVDNISGITDIVEKFLEQCNLRDINLTKLSQFVNENHKDVNVRFNPEVFGCMVTRMPDCTVLLYGQGKVVLIGSHSIEAMKYATRWLKEVVTSAKASQAL